VEIIADYTQMGVKKMTAKVKKKGVLVG